MKQSKAWTVRSIALLIILAIAGLLIYYLIPSDKIQDGVVIDRIVVYKAARREPEAYSGDNRCDRSACSSSWRVMPLLSPCFGRMTIRSAFVSSPLVEDVGHSVLLLAGVSSENISPARASRSICRSIFPGRLFKSRFGPSYSRFRSDKPEPMAKSPMRSAGSAPSGQSAQPTEESYLHRGPMPSRNWKRRVAHRLCRWSRGQRMPPWHRGDLITCSVITARLILSDARGVRLPFHSRSEKRPRSV